MQSHSARVIENLEIIPLLPSASGTLLNLRRRIYLYPSKRWNHPGVSKSLLVWRTEVGRPTIGQDAQCRGGVESTLRLEVQIIRGDSTAVFRLASLCSHYGPST